MTQPEKQQLKALLVAMSVYYGQQLPDAVIALHVEDLADLPYQKVTDAYAAARRDPRNTRLPLPAQIREIVAPKVSPDDEAREIAANIAKAIARIGSHQSARAQEFLGPIGWRVVDLAGGWVRVCELLNDRTQTQLMAQWRDLAGSLLRRAKVASLEAPSLPSPAGSPIQISNLIRSMPKSEGER